MLDVRPISVFGGQAVSAFAVGKAPANGQAFDEALYTAGPFTVTGGSLAVTIHGAAAVSAPRESVGSGPLPTRR